MALSQSEVSELLDALRAGDGVDLIRDLVRFVLQVSMEQLSSAPDVVLGPRPRR
jgi:hypothetical protein